jgi:hypothetical protein
MARPSGLSQSAGPHHPEKAFLPSSIHKKILQLSNNKRKERAIQLHQGSLARSNNSLGFS